MERRLSDRKDAGPFRDHIRGRVHAVIDAYCADPRDPALVAAAVDQLAADARVDGVPPETLVVALRNLWHERAPSGSLDPDVKGAALHRLLALYLTTHFRDPSSPPHSPSIVART